MRAPELDLIFVRWTWWRALLHRGWWLVTSVHLVVDLRLSAAQLVLIGVAQGAVALIFEIPAGVLADGVSRRWSLIVSQLLMGGAMIVTGLVSGFGPVVATQMLWGLAWTFASGADVAWISDELAEPARVARTLLRSGRAELTGAVAGMLAVGGLAWLTNRATAMVVAGSSMLLLGLYVLTRFRETRFRETRFREGRFRETRFREGRLGETRSREGRFRETRFVKGRFRQARFRERRFRPAPGARWRTSWSIFARGWRLARGSRVVLVMFAATFLVNGAAGVFGRLYPQRLVGLGLPADPIGWLTALSVFTYLTGAAALRTVQPRTVQPRTVQPRMTGERRVRRGYVVACAVAAAGIVAVAVAPGRITASLAVVLAAAGFPLARTFATIVVNGQATAEVRATVHSLLAQAEYLGAIACGLAVAAAARWAGPVAALLTCAALVAIALAVIVLATAGPTGGEEPAGRIRTRSLRRC